MIELARAAGKPVLVDPKGSDYARYRGATVITPNRAELAAGGRPLVAAKRSCTSAPQALRAALGLDGAAADPLRGRHVAVRRRRPRCTCRPQAREVFDVTGAGDTVIATLAAMLACGPRACARRCRSPTAPAASSSASSAPRASATTSCSRGGAAMRVVVTGAAGMIGANLVHGLNAIGIDDVIAVDDLSDGAKYRNLRRRVDQRLLRPARLLRALRARRARPRSTPCSTRAPAPTRWSTTAG